MKNGNEESIPEIQISIGILQSLIHKGLRNLDRNLGFFGSSGAISEYELSGNPLVFTFEKG